MDKPSKKEPIIPEMNIPDVAEYQPSDSALTHYAIRSYLFVRNKPRILVGSLGALAVTAGAIGFVAMQSGSITTLPPIETSLADIDAPASPEIPVITYEYDNRIEESDHEELRTSIKPLDLPEMDTADIPEIDAETVAAPAGVNTEKVTRLEVTAIPIAKEVDETVSVPDDVSQDDATDAVFAERFSEAASVAPSEDQEALVEALTRIGTIEQSVEQLKSFPFDKFDKIIKADVHEPKYALLKIVEGAEATSGFWRETEVPGSEAVREEHFLIVKAVDEESGEPINVDVKDMDTGQTKKEASWAVLIPEQQFLDFAESKQEDGTFSEPLLGKLNLETGEVEWTIDTDGSALINWKEFAE